MSLGLSIIQGPYFHDLLAQPRSLADTLDKLKAEDSLKALVRKFGNNEYDRIVLTGMGSSFHALYPLSLRLAAGGLTPLMIETSELDYYYAKLLGPRTLLIAVSQSGESVEIVRLLEINNQRSPVIAVTNSPQSSLALSSDSVVLTHAGPESTVSCKTYVATLVALVWLGDLLCREDLSETRKEIESAIPLMECYLNKWNNHTEELGIILKEAQELFLVGRGSSLAAVGTGGLIIKESTHLHAEGMSSAAFRHGPMEMLSKGTFVLIFSGDPKTVDLNRRLWRDIQNASGKTGWVGPDATSGVFLLDLVPRRILPLLEILPIEMMTLALAALAGREAGRFERAEKVTMTE
ncbi:MAG TPA: SIS domain-containing protein [Terriglobia bacterium]|nr:SIS domain-containing protein [Terriglobia bacterium]